MGFYNSKLNQYSTSIPFNAEQLEATKERIIEQKKKYIEELKNDIRVSRMAGFEGDYEDYETQKESYFLALKELDFIQTMNTLEFYQYMISLENYNLCKIEDKAFTDMANNIKALGKYKSQKGLVGKASSLLGIDKKRIEQISKLVEDNNLTVDFTQESRKEWQEITPENQALYIVGRFEVDGKTGFDKKGYENYKLEAFKKAAEKFIDESETGMEK